MSFIPSFILSALLFCNVSVPVEWDGATFTEGIICEIPNAKFIVSVDEHPFTGKSLAGSEQGSGSRAFLQPELRNAAFLFQTKEPDLKFAAGSLSVSGTSCTSELSASLSGKADGAKPLAFYAVWENLSFLATTGLSLKSALTSQMQNPFFNRAIIQFQPGFLNLNSSGSGKTGLKLSVTAGWFRLKEKKDNTWFLRYLWHGDGNLFFLNSIFTVRYSSGKNRFEADGIIRLSLPDQLEPAAGGGLRLYMKTPSTETTLTGFITPAVFMQTNGSYTNELLKTEGQFLMEKSLICKDIVSDSHQDKKKTATGKKAEKIELTFKANASYVQKQPDSPDKAAKQVLSGSTSCCCSTSILEAGVSVTAAKFCPEEDFQNGELIHELEIQFMNSALTGKVTLLPLKKEKKAEGPAWSLKAEQTLKDFSASYTAEFNGLALGNQEFSLTGERAPVSIEALLDIRKKGLSWSLSISYAM